MLYRAARAADPDYFPAQYEYISMMALRFRGPELRREFASIDSGSARNACLIAGTQASPYNAEPLARVRVLETRFGPSPCTDVLLLEWDDHYSPARGARAMRDSPELGAVWSAVASRLSAAGQRQAADQTRRTGITVGDDPIAKVTLALERIDEHATRRDTVGAVALWKTLFTDVRRDGRPGPLAAYFSARCTGRHDFPHATPESRSENCRQFNAIVRPRHAWFTEWAMLRAPGKDLLEQGRLTEAAPLLTRSVELADSIGTAGLQLDSYVVRGRAFAKAGHLAQAMRDLRRAIAIGPAAETSPTLAEAYHNLAHTYESAGRFAEAAFAADSFAAIAGTMRLNPGRMMGLHDAGMIRWKAGWHAAATRDFDAMVRAVDEVGDGHAFAGEYFERVGDLGRALEYYRAGVKTIHRDPRNLAALARIFEALGLPDSAEAAARQHDAEPDRWPILERPLLPDVLARRGRVADAISLDDAWARHEMVAGNIQGAAIAQLHLAKLLLLNREPKRAHAAAASADSLSHLLRLTAETIEARTLEGRALFDQGMRSVGLVALRDAVRLATAHPSTDALLSTNLALGNALETSSNRADALSAYHRAATAVERMTAGLSVDADRTGFKSLHLAPFDGALRILLRDTALEANAEAALRWSVRRKAAALTLAGEPGIKAPRRLSVARVRDALGADEALIDFTVLDSTVGAVVVRRQATTEIPLRVSPSQLAAWIDALRRPLVATPGGRVDLAHSRFDAAIAESLFHALIVPLGAALGRVSRLAIVPDGALWYVPFAALVTGRLPDSAGARGRPNYLIERYEVRLLPSAQFLSGGSGGNALRSGFRVEAFTYDVPGGAAELAAIRTAVGSSRVLPREGSAATERSALNASADILHLAVHGAVDDRDPLASHLRLAPAGRDDGLLHLSEVTARRLVPRLIVLTACEAVNGKLYAGEGLVGLARAFLVSGAHQVIASEWPVDASAAELTGVFYRELVRGRSPSAALRSAQLALLQVSGTAHPIHWAGFVAFDGGAGRPGTP